MGTNIHQLLNNFNAGELSPLVDARSDTGKYRSGCLQLRNFIPRAVGGAFSRPGTQYLGAAKYTNKKCRLIDFNFSISTSFQLEFGDLYVRFWTQRQQVLVLGVPYEIVSPYTEAELYEIQYRQINDVTYLIHPNHPPQKLSRIADDNWTLTEIDQTYPALLDENVEATTITPSGTTGAITLTASAALFNALHVGAFFGIAHRRDNAYISQGITGNLTTSAMRVIGSVEFSTFGTWAADIVVETSDDNGTTWESVRVFKSNSDRNVAPTVFDYSEEVQIRIRIANWSSAVNARAMLEAVDSKVYGLVKITGFTSSTVVNATVIRDLAKTTATKTWSEGAWSPYQGYPRAVTFHEQRIIYAGTTRQPLRVWGSSIGDFENFTKTTLDDASFDYVIASTQSSQIQWLCANSNGLIIGTAAEEWLMHSGSETSAITPTNVRVIRQSSEGSEYIAGRLVKNVVLFVNRYGLTLSEMAYSFEEDSLKANNMTILAEHVTKGGIKQTAYQARKDDILWCVTGEGKLVGLTYQREHEVSAWHTHDTDGAFESVSVNYSNDGTADEVWFSVKRNINGADVRYIESFYPAMQQFDYSDTSRLVCMDAAATYSGAPATVITGLSHLEGETVAIRADGGTLPSQTVTGGQITLASAASVVVVGLPFVPQIQPMKVELQLADGSSRARRHRPNKIVLSVYESLGAEVSENPTRSTGAQWSEIPFRRSEQVMDDEPPLLTDDIEWSIDSPYDTSVRVAVRQVDPQPLNILAMVFVFTVDS